MAKATDVRYDKLMEAFEGPALVNVRRHHATGRKLRQIGWLTT